MIQVEALPTESEATDVLERALASGLDPETGPPRSVAEVPAGQILLMPAAVPGYAGVKVATVAPGNRDLPRIQGVYLLLDGDGLTPLALLDGVELTSVRTPAVSALAVRYLAVPDASRLVVFGTGPQAWGHVRALRAVRPIEQVTVVGRSGTAAFVERCRASGLHASAGTPGAVSGADVVACCTTAREPLFAGDLVPAHAVVVAVGSHEPTAREVDGALVARSDVFVESRDAALREAGDLIIPGLVRAPRNIAELVAGGVRPPEGRPRLFKSVGMAWEDLVVAVAAYERTEA
jgi:ornithine cyclodeaminase/alanine dehydrogenase-like protein (mu-crystallin family)